MDVVINIVVSLVVRVSNNWTSVVNIMMSTGKMLVKISIISVSFMGNFVSSVVGVSIGVSVSDIRVSSSMVVSFPVSSKLFFSMGILMDSYGSCVSIMGARVGLNWMGI